MRQGSLALTHLSWVLRDRMPMVEAGHCVLSLHLYPRRGRRPWCCKGVRGYHNKTKQDVSVKQNVCEINFQFPCFHSSCSHFPSFVIELCLFPSVFIVQVCYHTPTSIAVLSLPLSYMISGQSSLAIPEGRFSLTFGEGIMT